MNDYKLAEEYDNVIYGKRGLRNSWHYIKFKSVIDCFRQDAESILDVGCASCRKK